jgi:hypothetical protein
VKTLGLFALVVMAVGCGDDGSTTCDLPPPTTGDPDGHPEPLGSGPAEARAGRVEDAELPPVPSGMITWRGGDFVIANDKVALVIEDVGDSDLYDPWGGRPVGLARVAGGQMIEPNDFGEMFFLTGRSTVLTEDVSVINDGSNGEPAVIRAIGRLAPLPFFDAITSAIFPDGLDDITAAIDYELAPGAEHVDVRFRYVSPRGEEKEITTILHAAMYTKRTPAYLPNTGFDDAVNNHDYLALIDDTATSWAYLPAEGVLGAGVSVSGFVGSFTSGFNMPACGELDRVHARIVIGGPGVNGVVAAVERTLGRAQRTITGTVTRDGGPATGTRVHAVDSTNGAYLGRAPVAADGSFAIDVPAAATVALEAFRRGDAIASITVGPQDPAPALVMPASGAIHVTASDPGGNPLPARVQVLATGASPGIPGMPPNYGERQIAGGRLHIEFAVTGDVTLPAPPGQWEVVVSRGYEYDVDRQTVTVVAGNTVDVDATLDRVVATPDTLCGDFHIHTARSNDSADTPAFKLAGAVVDGVELPVRSEHEYVDDFADEIAAIAVEPWAAAIASIELTSFEVWGHMGVFPLTPDPSQVNNGAPRWQTFPTAEDPTEPLAMLSPVDVFNAVRARPESPVVIINHPRGGRNYFTYVGYDPATGMVDQVGEWDTSFTLVEVFNDSGWIANRDNNARDWLGLLRAGRRVFAVGSSDSHGIASSPVGYPRTCIATGTDDPRQATGPLVRDAMAAGHHTVSGGIYVAAAVGAAGPGDTASGLGTMADVAIEIQAALWVDVDAFDVVVDGEIVDTITIMPGDADPSNPVLRWSGVIQVPVSATGNGFVVIAAYGSDALEPVHPGRIPFGVTNPIFLVP